MATQPFSFRIGFLFIAVLMEVFSFSFDQGPQYTYAVAQSVEIVGKEQRVEAQPISNMRDALGQLLVIGFEGTELTPELAETIAEIRPGGLLLLRRNIVDPEQTMQLIRDLQEFSLATTGFPLFVAVDQEGSPVTRVNWAELKTPQSELETFTEAYQIGTARARELRELGFNMNLAPVLDSGTPDDYLFSRSFQKDYEEAKAIAKGLVLGHEKEEVFVVPKHFPGYDDILDNPENGVIPVVSELPDTSLFQDIVGSTDQKFVMVSHVIYGDVDPVHPFPFSAEGLRFLRAELSEDIIVMSDDLTSSAFLESYNAAEIGARSLAAGVDILLLAGHLRPELISEFYEGLVKVVEQDELLQAQVVNSVERIIQIKNAI